MILDLKWSQGINSGLLGGLCEDFVILLAHTTGCFDLICSTTCCAGLLSIFHFESCSAWAYLQLISHWLRNLEVGDLRESTRFATLSLTGWRHTHSIIGPIKQSLGFFSCQIIVIITAFYCPPGMGRWPPNCCSVNFHNDSNCDHLLQINVRLDCLTG